MNTSPMERRMAENEVVFRRFNEKIQQGFDELSDIAKDAGQTDMVEQDDAPLHFCCECSDENCLERVLVRPSRYRQIHKRRDCFIVVRGHEQDGIERVTDEENGYCIVEKFYIPPETVPNLKPTTANNV